MDAVSEKQSSNNLTNLLKNTDANWQMLMANVPNYIVITDRNGVIQFINYTVAGLDNETVYGTFIYDFAPEEQQYIITDAIERVLTTGNSTTYEIEGVGDQLQAAWYFVNVGPIKEDEKIVGLIFIATDVSERKHAQQLLETRVAQRTEELKQKNQELNQEITVRKQIENALRENERRYRTLAAMSPVGIFLNSANGECIYANERCEQLCGVPFEKLKSFEWVKFLHPDDRNQVLISWREAVNNKMPYKAEYRYLHPDNTVCWVLCETTPELDEHNNLHGHVGTLTDITKLRQIQAQVQQHQQELAHFSRITTIAEMASGFAHELNQPLTAIVHYVGGCLTRLKTSNITDDIITTMQQVAVLAERAGEIIHRLKNFLRNGDTQMQPMQVNTIIEETVALLEPEIIKLQINLSLKLTDNLPLVFVDRIHIIQAILNIAHNAIETMSTLPTKQRSLIIKTQLNPNNKIAISIRDNGPGIAANVIDKIFNPFFSTKENGMGMGLSISRRIIETHKGNIVFTNHSQNGCEFMLTLPIYREENDEHQINNLHH